MTASPTDDHASAERRIQELTKELFRARGELAEARERQTATAGANKRLFEEVQTRNTELRAAIEQQTATSDILRVIGSSPTNVQPVFDAIVQNAKRLLSGYSASVMTLADEQIQLAAFTTTGESGDESLKTSYPRALTSSSVAAGIIRDLGPCFVSDTETDERIPSVTREAARRRGYRSFVAVPMVRQGRAVGIISVTRRETGIFRDEEIALIKTFADQAVIAIENTRLFEAEQASKREVQESLEYQTATAEVLNVISRSPSQVQPVLVAIAETAGRLCQAENTAIWLLAEDAFQLAAHTTSNVAFAKYLAENPLPTGSDSLAGRVVLARRTIHVPDVLTDPILSARPQFIRGKTRTALGVPLLRDGTPSGVIVLTRPTVLPFTDKQIELVKTFADQAVIAIENARLFEAEQASKRELTEALEQQTATADVLKVISRSALDLQRVLDALVESVARLCDAQDTAIFQVLGDSLRLVAHHGQIPMAGPVGQLTRPLMRGRIAGRAVLDRRTIHVADVIAEGDEFPDARTNARQLGFRTALGVPLVHAGEAIGAFFIRRAEVHPFTDRQIELVNTFADQAVIAIENTRLFEEVQARTRELAKTVEDLEIASQHKNQFVANMSHELRTPLAAILGYAELIQEGFYGPQPEKSMDALTRIRSNGKHLLGLINTVLDIAKIESGQFTLNMTEYAIESVVETVRAATESLAQNKKLTLTTSVDKSLPVGLGDEQRLTQVLLNLVGNAIKFTDAGEVCIAACARNGHFAVSVTDTGPGIPLDQQDRIFDQFHQVDSSLTKAKGGTGLGLAIAKQIVEMHGGRIWVESTLGKGSTFQMVLPTRADFRKPIQG
jgi:signal transduction histidine kinase